MKLHRKYIIIGSALVVTLLFGGGAILLVKHNASQNEAKKAQASHHTMTKSSSPNGSISSDNVQFLETALNNSDKSERAKAVVPELRGNSWLANATLPKGATVSVDRDSFRLIKNGRHATMDGSINSILPIDFTLQLRQVEGNWLIESAEQK